MNINVKNDEMLGRTNDSIYATKFYVMQKQIDNLQQENTNLKIQISAREEEYNKLEDKYIHNVPCCNEDDCDLYRNYMKLEDNWNKLKTFIVNEIPEEEFVNSEYYVSILDKMKELERGVSDVED